MNPAFFSRVQFSTLLLLCFTALHPSFAQNATPLSNVTLGFGAGYHYTLGNVQEYTLSPDSNYTLQIQDMNRGAFVLSSIVTVRLGKVAKISGSSRLYSQTEIAEQDITTLKGRNASVAKPKESWCLNLALNVAEITGAGLAFNKSVDGGLGIGYYLTDAIQVGAFLDVQRVRQLRQYVVRNYADASIPQNTGIYTALDPADNVLFTTRTFAGASLKFIYTLPNGED